MNDLRPFRAAIERRARESPEEPFLFFRGERGHFRWWSFAHAAACLAGTPGAGAERAGEGEAAGFLAAADEAEDDAGALSLAGALGPAPTGRDIWISHRPLPGSPDAVLALWAARSGAAVLREPGERLHPELFAWARPTLLSAPEMDLIELVDGFAALAPRLGARRWRRRRLARLRAALVETGGCERLAVALSGRGAPPALRVLSFPGAGD